MKVPKIHLSRKLMLIAGGILVTLGGTGAAAVYIGTDKLLGPSYAELNGLECTEVKTVEIRKRDSFWVRKFITTDEPGDGLARVKTALRVAKSLQETKKADLVQVVVLDTNGPKDRSGMRGRAVGADVIYVPDPSHVPEEAGARMLTARYIDGAAAGNGEFFGERVDMLEADIQALVAKLNDQTDCVKPEVVVPEGEAHGEKAAEGHGEAPAHGAEDAHGEKPAEGQGETEGHGEAEGGHGDAPAGEHGEETPVAEHGAEESKGWMASLMGMVGLGGEDAPAEGHAAPADGAGAVAEGHEAPADDHAEPAVAAHGDAGTSDAHGETAPGASTEHAAVEPAQYGEEPVAGAAHAEASQGDASHGEAPAHGTEQVAHTEEKPATVEETAHGGASAGHQESIDQAVAPEVAAEEEPAADGGWFASLKSMVGLGGADEEAPAEDATAKAEEAPAGGGAASTDHGAAWLEKMRSQPITPAAGGAAAPAAKPEEHGAVTDGHAPAAEQHAAKSAADPAHAVPAEDEAILPPKVKVKGDEHAKAGH